MTLRRRLVLAPCLVAALCGVAHVGRVIPAWSVIMIVLVVLAQLAATPAIAGDTAMYASPALRDIVTAAAAENVRLTHAIPAYRATVESELAWIRQDSIDREQAVLVQQHASRIQWQNGVFDVHVTSARPSVHLPDFVAWPSTPIWLLPALYGERIPFVFERWFTRTARNPATGDRTRDTIAIEHPFASTRERRYRYSGGDTVATIRVNGRRVTIVRIHVTPHFSPDERAAAFDGDLFLDATRSQIVRIRGRIIRSLPVQSAAARLQRATASTIAPYIEVTNEEVAGQFWLPRTERVELQLASAVLLGTREIWRLMATFSDHEVDSTTPVAADRANAEPRIHVSVPTEAALRGPHEWTSPLGVATHDVHSVDFGDIAPPDSRDDGPPRFTMQPSRASRVFHIDPIEGVYTGLEGTMNLRDAAPGASIRGFGGWAWAERTVRGGASVAWRRDSRVTSVFAQRSLETTNDFLVSRAASDPVNDLVGFAERRDYVDRVTAALSWSDIRRSAGDGIFSAQIGGGRDGSEQTRYTHSLFPRLDSVLPNRGATNGSYGRVALDYEWHPDVTAENNLTGIRAQLHYEAATGQLAWQRATIAIAHRGETGPVVFVERLDAGMVASPNAIPPQQMFELGGYEHLHGYSYKQFAGDRAAVASSGAGYLFPIFQTTRMPGIGGFLPPINPGVNAGFEFGWTTLSSDAAREAILAMSTTPGAAPLSVATDGVRGSGGFGLTLFSGLFHVGLARALDSGAKWRRVVGIGVNY